MVRVCVCHFFVVCVCLFFVCCAFFFLQFFHFFFLLFFFFFFFNCVNFCLFALCVFLCFCVCVCFVGWLARRRASARYYDDCATDGGAARPLIRVGTRPFWPSVR